MKGKVFLILFALPFAGVGVWAGYSVVAGLAEAWQMQGWAQARAELVDAGYRSHTGDESTTYEAYASYRYRVAGRSYAGARVGIAAGADNIGDYQIRTGKRLAQQMRRGEPVIVYYDPDSPQDSIIDRDLRWGLLGFKSIFLLVFGGLGGGLLYAVARTPRFADDSNPAGAGAPWLRNDAWQTAEIRSGSRVAMLGAWLFAALWNLVSAPLPFLLLDEIRNQGNYLALVGLLFPAVGLGLLVWAVGRTREWTRFGPAPVVLDPFPGAIGGHVGGRIDLGLPYDPSATFEVVLTSLHSYVSGSGKHRSRREKALWQDELAAVAEPGPRGTRLTFRFEVPDGLAESDAHAYGNSYHAWRLSVTADLAGADFDRCYDIPVYATGARSASLSPASLERGEAARGAAAEQAVRRQLRLGFDAQGRQVHYPAGRNLLTAAPGALVGVLFAGAGYFIAVHKDELLFGGVFGGVGLLVVLAMLYVGLNSLTVSSAGGRVTSTRRIAGVVVSKKSLPADRITRLSRGSSFQTQSGGRHVMHYSVFAHDRAGNRLTLGEGFKGDGNARAAMRLLSRELGLRVAAETTDAEDAGDLDVLVADS